MPTTLRFERALLGADLTSVDDAWITIDRGSIVATGSGNPPAGAVAGPSRVVMPGLVDCHVHLALSGSADVVAEVEAMAPEDAVDAARRNAPRHLADGVTTVRDLGSPFGATRALARELDAVAPTIVTAGAISSPTGHGNFLAAHADTVDEYDAELRRLSMLHVPFVKLFATGGVITAGTVPGAVQLAQPLLGLVVARAHARGLRVAAHAHGQEGIANAIAAGVDTIEHFSYLGDDDVEALRATCSTLVSTLVATERFVSSPSRELATPETLAKIIAHAPNERRSLVRAITADARVAVGTDAGTTFNPHGGGMHEQAHHLQRAGSTPREVLRMLTTAGATAIGTPAGMISIGRRADLLCLDDDPATDLDLLASPAAVMVRGRWFEG